MSPFKMEQIRSQRGREKFAHNGYLFVFNKISKIDSDLMFWRCEQVGRCSARLHTKLGSIVKEINIHSHNSSAMNVEAAIIATKLKLRAEETMEQPSVVINEILTNTPEATHGSLPKAHAMKKTIRRKRNQIRNAPLNPVDLNQLTFPYEYTVYKPNIRTEEVFLLSDNGAGNERILIFGRKSWIQHLVASDSWYCDGTFKVAPKLFTQVYVILAQKLDGVIPIIYALLTNKRRATYARMFEMLNSIEPCLDPTAIVCDYEQAAISAMKEIYPHVGIKGCFFHLSQNLQRQLTAIGSTKLYNNDVEFALKTKMILALAFVPIDQLDPYFDALANDLTTEHIPLLNWFEDNYIGRLNRRGNSRRAPLFPPEIWNVYTRTISQEDRTNNHAEAANRRLQSELGMDHPTIWKFIDAIRKIQKGRDMFLEQLVAGNPPSSKLKKYRDADERILEIVLSFEERTPIEYLRGIAYNYN